MLFCDVLICRIMHHVQPTEYFVVCPMDLADSRVSTVVQHVVHSVSYLERMTNITEELVENLIALRSHE